MHSFMSAETHILHLLYFDFAYKAAHTTTNYISAVIVSIDIIFAAFSQLVRMRHIRSCFDLASELNPASIWVANYIRMRELVESNATTFSCRCFDQKRDRIREFHFIACWPTCIRENV